MRPYISLPLHAVAAARRCRSPLSVLAHVDGAPVELAFVEHLDGGERVARRSHRHQAAALGAAVATYQHVGVGNVARLAEVVLQTVPRRLVRQVANVELCIACADTSASGCVAGGRGRNTRGREPTCRPRGGILARPRRGEAIHSAAHAAGGRADVCCMGSVASLAVFAHEDVAAVELCLMELLDRKGGVGGRAHRHDAAALGAALRRLHNVRVHDIPDLGEEVLQALP
mmetsp:Transcript_364/g.734  ORF Transcript_364/g.734 Transcript_364/m.734 type:complete len:229 (-) Transcript_364:803-1489(-)